MENLETKKTIPVIVKLSDESLRFLSVLAMLDDTTLGSQIRTAVTEYTNDRKQSPTLPEEVAAAKKRRIGRDNMIIIKAQIAELGLEDLWSYEE